MAATHRYTTPEGYGETEIRIQKSRFITYVNRVDSEEEASSFVRGIAKTHWDATHNCYAYVVGRLSEVQRSSDDGEPSGTAGRPILEAIRSRGLTDTAVVVTRYFGGIKLGAGGLIRAYNRAATEGLDAAGQVDWYLHRSLEITADYPAMGKLEHELIATGYEMEPPRFTDQVRWKIWVPNGEEQPLIDLVAEQTSGRGSVEYGEVDYRPRTVK
ncbi:YigZ family protein [Paludifilum halophilum]|uniref:YigZ family protein n=1 Tax=Paludifilum halophilum TaxID=1642702 RepID=A0A235B6W3_9BACL|nr:YigZ family protein [Paludifilum halophilum]OYD08048.1 YigZ family protein [Paludifilum halophilum]